MSQVLSVPRQQTCRQATLGSPVAAPTREVVAVTVRHAELTALFRRSSGVGSDAGLWHCITGFVEPGVAPLDQARLELTEEAGYPDSMTQRLVLGPVLELRDQRQNQWLVHTYRLDVASTQVVLNWEHDDVRWLAPTQLASVPTVPWLDDVLLATA